MLTGIKLIVATACMGAALTAHAGVFRLNFTATGFEPLFSATPSPVDTVTGSIDFIAAKVGDPIENIVGVKLSIHGHTYGVGDVSGMPALWDNNVLGGYIFGNPLGGVTSAAGGTNDFILLAGNNVVSMLFTSPPTDAAWKTENMTYTYSAVPEPDSGALWLAGLSALALLRRRRSY